MYVCRSWWLIKRDREIKRDTVVKNSELACQNRDQCLANSQFHSPMREKFPYNLINFQRVGLHWPKANMTFLIISSVSQWYTKIVMDPSVSDAALVLARVQCEWTLRISYYWKVTNAKANISSWMGSSSILQRNRKRCWVCNLAATWRKPKVHSHSLESELEMWFPVLIPQFNIESIKDPNKGKMLVFQ